MAENQSFVQFLNSLNPNSSGAGKFSHLVARVAHVVQGPFYIGTNLPDPNYKDPTSIGTITFELLNSNQSSTLVDSGNVTAKPLNSAIKQIPLEGELVYLIPGPSVDMNDTLTRLDYYYLLPYNTWNATNHNAFPSIKDYSNFILETIGRSYQDSLSTNQGINTAATSSLVMPLTSNFPEKSDIRTLRQFTGDTTIEGRWGNSIRFGSTIAVNGYENPWSSEGTKGSPITIIRNGQGTTAKDPPWFPTVENINRDPSSIYLTAGQKIVIDDINNNFSLASLQTQLQRTQTKAIPIQQQLTSTTNISALDQDRRIDSINS